MQGLIGLMMPNMQCGTRLFHVWSTYGLSVRHLLLVCFIRYTCVNRAVVSVSRLFSVRFMYGTGAVHVWFVLFTSVIHLLFGRRNTDRGSAWRHPGQVLSPHKQILHIFICFLCGTRLSVMRCSMWLRHYRPHDIRHAYYEWRHSSMCS